MTKTDLKALERIAAKINFDEEDITHYLIYSFILNHYPGTNIIELDMAAQTNDFKDALSDVLDYVKYKDELRKSVFTIVK